MQRCRCNGSSALPRVDREPSCGGGERPRRPGDGFACTSSQSSPGSLHIRPSLGAWPQSPGVTASSEVTRVARLGNKDTDCPVKSEVRYTTDIFSINISHAMFGKYFTKKLCVVYMKCRFYWASCVLSVNHRMGDVMSPGTKSWTTTPRAPGAGPSKDSPRQQDPSMALLTVVASFYPPHPGMPGAQLFLPDKFYKTGPHLGSSL